VLPSCATSRGHSPIRNLGTRVAAVVPQHASQSLTQADTTELRRPHTKAKLHKISKLFLNKMFDYFRFEIFS